MRVSVVINTCNRAKSLRVTLEALRYQTHPDFEVVVVNGPSTDDTQAVLAEWGDAIRAYRCPERVIAKSRNDGIAVAAGEVIAFIDDDAVPEPDWLAELVTAYTDPKVGGAGGIVYDHTGTALQYGRSAATRLGTTVFDLPPPPHQYTRPGADPFLYLQGTNCSFRREVLVAVGGFNDEIEYYLEETEVCLRAIDAGYELVALPRAAVHHKYLPSHVRDHTRTVRDPYPIVKNQAAFAVRYGRPARPATEVFAAVAAFANRLKQEAAADRAAGRIDADRLARFNARVDAAIDTGVTLGLTAPRPVRTLPPADPAAYRPFPTLKPSGGRRRLCHVLPDYPAKATAARADAAAGHVVHVVCRGAVGRTVDFEHGVWVHRVPDPVTPDALVGVPDAAGWARAAAVYHEVERIGRAGPAALIAADVPDARVLRAVRGAGSPAATLAAAGLSADAAAALLAAERFAAPRDYPTELAALWGEPDERFVGGLYQLLFGRQVDGIGRSHFVGALRTGTPRREVVRLMLSSDEAAARCVPTDWFGAFAPPAPPPPRVSFARRVARAAIKRLPKRAA